MTDNKTVLTKDDIDRFRAMMRDTDFLSFEIIRAIERTILAASQQSAQGGDVVAPLRYITESEYKWLINNPGIKSASVNFLTEKTKTRIGLYACKPETNLLKAAMRVMDAHKDPRMETGSSKAHDEFCFAIDELDAAIAAANAATYNEKDE